MASNQQEYINERWEQLYKLLMSITDDGIKYLFTVHGGGCVAVLAFIGGAKDEYKATMWAVLVTFFIGLVLVGCLNVERYRHFSRLIKIWNENSTKFYLNEMTFKELIEKDKDAVKKGEYIVWWGYASFACILIAGLIGIHKYML